MRNSAGETSYRIHSLERGLKFLEVLADHGEPLTLSQVSDVLGLRMSTAFRFLFTLQRLEYVEREPAGKRYRIGPKVLKLGFGFFASSALWQTAHPHLVQARKDYRETFNLAILDDTDILYVDRVKTRKILTINLEIGSKLPAYCTAMGRVLLAHRPKNQVRDILRRARRKRFTPRTVTRIVAIERLLETVKRQGYAINNGEIALELISVAAPVRNYQGDVVAALNMAVNAGDYAPEAIEETLVPAVKTVASQISQALGHMR
jgi:IclR family pca regulon transcriptional regulator